MSAQKLVNTRQFEALSVHGLSHWEWVHVPFFDIKAGMIIRPTAEEDAPAGKHRKVISDAIETNDARGGVFRVEDVNRTIEDLLSEDWQFVTILDCRTVVQIVLPRKLPRPQNKKDYYQFLDKVDKTPYKTRAVEVLDSATPGKWMPIDFWALRPGMIARYADDKPPMGRVPFKVVSSPIPLEGPEIGYIEMQDIALNIDTEA